MLSSISFAGEALTAGDVASLRDLAQVLWRARHAIAHEWARRLVEALPEYLPEGSPAAARLPSVNEAFLSLVLQQIQAGDLQGLYDLYYRNTRDLIEADLQRAPAHRVSLSNLYTSARVSLVVIGEYLDADYPRRMLAYTKLTAQLMMLVGQAYSDAREEYLQKAFEQINTVSHELRAPLSNLFGYLEMLHAGDFGPVSREQERVLGELIHESDDVLWLLTSTLDLSRLDTGRVAVRVEDFALPSVLIDVINSTRHAQGRVTLSVPDNLPALRTDRIKVKQIVGNLLRNAVRYGGSGPVEVTAEPAPPGAVVVSVRDHGPGIKADELRVIFDFFQRGRSAGPERDGYGIGLHVVRRLVRMLNGNIAVESTPGAGACFRVTMPNEFVTSDDKDLPVLKKAVAGAPPLHELPAKPLP
jgi:signal transduction histidine kinase